MSRIPTQGLDYTSKDYEAFREMMLKELGFRMPEYTDRRQSDAGIVLLELLAQGLDIISYYQDVIANEVYLSTSEQRKNALKWCSMLSYIPRVATASRFNQVFVLSSVQDTDVTIPMGTKVKTLETSAENEVVFETSQDLVIPAGKLGDEKVSGSYLYTVPVIQGTTISGELLGTSTDTENQRFLLNYTPVLVDSVVVLVNEGNGFERWMRVENFVESKPNSKHFTVTLSDNDDATITFGNGVFGKIPNRYTNGIYCDYRIGGGTDGNVGANKITVLDSNIAVVKETFNPELAFLKGQDKESLEEIKINAPVANRTLWGALTVEDFASVAVLNFPDIQYAIAEVDDGDRDDIHIYVLLKDNAPLTEHYKQEILNIFDANEGGRKIVGADEIFIEPPTFVPLALTANLIVQDRFTRDNVKKQIEDYIKDYFTIGNYNFNKELSLTELASNVMSPENAINGIKSFKFTGSSDILTPKANEIYTLNTLNIVATGGI